MAGCLKDTAQPLTMLQQRPRSGHLEGKAALGSSILPPAFQTPQRLLPGRQVVWRLKEGRSSRQDWGCGRQGPAGADSGDNDIHQIGYLQTGYAHVRGCLRAEMAVCGLEGPKPPFPFYIGKLPIFLHFVSADVKSLPKSMWAVLPFPGTRPKSQCGWRSRP